MAIPHHEIELSWDSDPTALGGRRARRAGHYQAYIPEPVTEFEPLIPASLVGAVLDAEQACLDLETTTDHVGVNLETLARQLMRAESVASSRIEGLVVTHRRLAEAAFAGSAGDFAARSVLQNIEGMNYALRIATDAPALTSKTFAEIHKAMFEGTRDDHLAGVVRDRQNWIGGEASTPLSAIFVPPPADQVEALLADLAEFCNQRADLSPVLQAAIAHAQFETIHPFWDGNGRVGRALIHVVLRRRGVVTRFLPPVSLVLASHVETYEKGLMSYRFGDEADWYAVFADALSAAARESVSFAERLYELQKRWLSQAGNPRLGSATAKLIDVLPQQPVLDTGTAVVLTGASEPAVLRALSRLEDAGVLRQTSVGRRNRAFECVGLFDLMDRFERTLGPVGRTPAATR